MKLVISTIVAGIVLFLLGWVFYGLLFMNYFTEYYSLVQRSAGDMKMWAIAVSCLLQGFFLSYFYPRMQKGGSPFGEGFKFGFLFGLFESLPYMFSIWATMPVTYKAVVVDAIIMFVLTLIAGIIIGLIYGKKGVEKITLKESPTVTAQATT
jgi:hypothetical protein